MATRDIHVVGLVVVAKAAPSDDHFMTQLVYAPDDVAALTGGRVRRTGSVLRDVV